jgi:hypothetical protein
MHSCINLLHRDLLLLRLRLSLLRQAWTLSRQGADVLCRGQLQQHGTGTDFGSCGFSVVFNQFCENIEQCFYHICLQAVF